MSNPSLGRGRGRGRGRGLAKRGRSKRVSSGRDQMGQGSSGAFESTSEMDHQRSHNMSSGSSQSLRSPFSRGGRGRGRGRGRGSAPFSSKYARVSDHSSRARFDNSSGDVDDRERFSRDFPRPSNDNRNDLRPSRRSFGDHPSGRSPRDDFGHVGSSRGPSYHERLENDVLRERERLRDEEILADLSRRKSEGDYNRSRSGYSSSQERPGFDKPRGIPSRRNIGDFRGISPKVFPHVCSLCDLALNSLQSWREHISGRLHEKQRLVLVELYPRWKGHGMGPSGDMGSPGARHGNFRERQGFEGRPGPRKTPREEGPGRVVHILDFERRSNLKLKLIKLAARFGTVTNNLILDSREEAFLEMATPEEANAVVSYYATSPAHLYGKELRVNLSQKYKYIKKFPGKGDSTKPFKQGPKWQQSKSGSKRAEEGPGRVLRICNLPPSGYYDNTLLKLAKQYGKITDHKIMRLACQALIEMEKPEDAEKMEAQCNKTPLHFKGKVLKVLISQKFKTLSSWGPKGNQQRKRTLSSDGKGNSKKQRKGKESDMVTSEDLVTTCEADDAEEAASVTSGSGDDAEGRGVGNENGKSEAAPEKMEGFVTLDEIGTETVKKDSAIKQENGVAEQPAEDMDTTPDGKDATNPADMTELGPYQPHIPTGVDYVIAKTGYYCRLCSVFYTNEDKAKVEHCSSLTHFQKLKNAKKTNQSPIKPDPSPSKPDQSPVKKD